MNSICLQRLGDAGGTTACGDSVLRGVAKVSVVGKKPMNMTLTFLSGYPWLSKRAQRELVHAQEVQRRQSS